MRAFSLIVAALMACGGATGKADQAVTIAKELRAKPDDAEKILGQHNMTPEQWEALMYEIAEDPALAAQYEAGLQK
jgi:uncharacterized protein YoaH (UPF0181 family)